MKLQVVGEDALMLYLGDDVNDLTLARVQGAVSALERALGADLVDLVPSFASVLILYDPLRNSYQEITGRIRAALAALSDSTLPQGRCIELPVLYSPEAGADLTWLAERAGLSVEAVIALHSAIEYRVYAIGFAPGFAYLGKVDERIAAPRKATPRPRVPRGSVAIADRQTAVYPTESPGGWNLIGRCPVSLFDPDAQPAMPVAVGDRVRFQPVNRERFLALGGELS